MDDVPVGSDKIREPHVPAQAGSGDVGVGLDSKAPDSSMPPNRHDLAAMLRASEETTVSVSPLHAEAGRSADSEASRSATDSFDARTIDYAPQMGHEALTIGSSVETILSGGPVRQSPGTSGANGVLLEIGTVLGGRYEILQLLGQGGMGAVYKAADREVERTVAVKVIRPEMASNPEILARFKQELLLSSKVTDRHVIRIYDIGEAQGVKFITMEYMEGDNLHKVLKDRGKLDVAEAVAIMEQVVSGLAAAHREGIIHRDLKPANIMVDKSGRVVVMDFGLARTFSGDGMTQTGMMLGTMEYMSPEQAQGIDTKASSDIFTVGLILYELLTGITPFHAETAIASLVKRTQQRAEPLTTIDKTIPGSLSNIVAKCLEKEPGNRYQSAEDLVMDLRAWQGKSVGMKVSVTSGQLRANRVKELPWLRLGVAGALLVAIAGGIAWYVLARRQAVATSMAHGPVSVLIGDFANHTGDSVLDNTLEPMLGVAMEGASFISVYSRGDARRLAKKLANATDVLDEQSSRLVAISQGVNAVITGEISMRDDKYDIAAIALDTRSGQVLAKADVTVANKQEILSELPKLAVPIRKALGDTTPSSVQLEKVSGGFKAASLEAVHQDALGVEQQFAGKFTEAFASFQKSAELDPKFARAYSGMAAMDLNLGKTADALKYMKMAMENVDRMTDREHYRNQGLYFQATGDWEDCVDQYSQLVKLYPADRVGQNNLATCYTELRDAPKALEAARHAVEIVPRGAGQHLNMAFIGAFAGDFVTSEKEARTALEISPTSEQGRLVLAEAKTGQGQLEEAADSYGELQKLGNGWASSAVEGLADLAAYRGEYAEAARILTQGAEEDTKAKEPDKAARKYAEFANLEELQAHHAAALAAIGKAMAASQLMQIQFMAARIYVEEGDLPKALKLVTSLSAKTAKEPQAYAKIIEGMIARKRKDPKAAIRLSTDANLLLDTWIGHFELGRANLEAGAFAEAAAEFDLCLKRRGEAIELFDDNVPTFAYFPVVYYYQGRAREGMKSPDAAESYKSYLTIRGKSKDDPLVADIRHLAGQ